MDRYSTSVDPVRRAVVMAWSTSLGPGGDLAGDVGGRLELGQLALSSPMRVAEPAEGFLLGVVQVAFAVLSVGDERLSSGVALLELLLETPDHGVVRVGIDYP